MDLCNRSSVSVQLSIYGDGLLGLAVKVSAPGAEDPEFDSHFFPGQVTPCISDLITGPPLATLPGAWRYRVSAGTGWLGVCIL